MALEEVAGTIPIPVPVSAPVRVTEAPSVVLDMVGARGDVLPLFLLVLLFLLDAVEDEAGSFFMSELFFAGGVGVFFFCAPAPVATVFKKCFMDLTNLPSDFTILFNEFFWKFFSQSLSKEFHLI